MEQATKERQTTTARTFKTRINLPADRREKLIALLNQQLADTFDLFGQTKQAHWNVKGPQFYQLHLVERGGRPAAPGGAGVPLRGPRRHQPGSHRCRDRPRRPQHR